MKTAPFPSPDVEACPTMRLAHGELAAVDMCHCGMLRLHLGAITLRLTPEALESVLDTLTEALHTRATLDGNGVGAIRHAHDGALRASALPRGQS